ncbi:TetR/AcrR family transcriptional regulator [Streptomyces sp. NPDC057137]|uniref:TetR/AcrR family transcriptional regulator n=1 Tax=Streptomyces sp. NPDC057137 TaxID=3346030 RepID=UPI00362A257E
MGVDRLTEVLDATYDCLTRYGARRTTMDDVASTMGVSRSSLYQHVRSKDDALRRLAERLHAQALDRARRAAAADTTSDRRIRGILVAKLDLILQLAGDSPHAAELCDEKTRLFGPVCRDFTAELRRLLVTVLTHAGVAEPLDAADICLALVAGLEAVPDGKRLLGPACTALTEGLAATS